MPEYRSTYKYGRGSADLPRAHKTLNKDDIASCHGGILGHGCISCACSFSPLKNFSQNVSDA